MFSLGCKWTVEYCLTGMVGGLAAVLTLPGCYVTLPRIRAESGEVRLYCGVVARLVVAGIAGCVVDSNTKNAFFGGFFSWHLFRWLSEDGWRFIRDRILSQGGKLK